MCPSFTELEIDYAPVQLVERTDDLYTPGRLHGEDDEASSSSSRDLAGSGSSSIAIRNTSSIRELVNRSGHLFFIFPCFAENLGKACDIAGQ